MVKTLRDLFREGESDELQELGWMEKKWSHCGRNDENYREIRGLGGLG